MEDYIVSSLFQAQNVMVQPASLDEGHEKSEVPLDSS